MVVHFALRGNCVLRCLAVVVALLSAAGTARAQLSTATVNGTVRDSSGSVVPSASLVLRSTGTNVERQTVSNNAGLYVFLNVLPGAYSLEATAPGFRTNRTQQFTLTVNQTSTIDFTLEVGTVEQSVTVEATGVELQASTAELGAVVAQKQVVELPLNGRNFTQLLALTPGVAPVSVSQNSGGFGGVVTSGAAFTFPAINGQTNRSNFYLLDGVNNQGAFTSTYAVPPIIDTIQEFKVQAHNDQTEFGGALGGIINVVTKGGTNELHGNAWEYLRNDVLDARNTFLPATQKKTPFRQNQFGANAGGPVYIPKVYDGRNKTFFHLGYQGFRYRRAAQSFYRVPTGANLRGDFSDVAEQIFDPFTTRLRPGTTGQYMRDAFPGNQIPASRVDAGLVTYAQATLPKPQATGLADRNAFDSTSQQQNQEDYTARVDQSFNKHFFWFRWSGLRQSVSGGRKELLNLNDRTSKNLAGSWVGTLSPTTVIQAQVARVHVRDDAFNRFQNVPANFAEQVGFDPNFYVFVDDIKLTPALNVDDYFSGGESNSLNPNFTDVWHYRGNASKIVGNHTFKFGGELASSNFEAYYNNGSSTFRRAQTADPANLARTGNALASYMLNVPDAAGRRNVHETVRWGGVLGFFFHDQWRASQKLTVNYGFRWDKTYVPPYGRDDTIGVNGGIETGSYDFNNGTYVLQVAPPTCASRGRAPCLPDPTGKLPDHVVISPTRKIYRNVNDNFQPRFGFAYRLRNSTVIRSGFGLYFDNWAAVTQTSQNYEGGWPDVAQQLENNLNTPEKVPGNPLPTEKGTNPFSSIGIFPAPTPFNQVLWYMDPLFKNPYSLQWNFGVQQQLNPSTLLTVNYVGSGSKRLNLGGYYNVATTPGPGNPRDRSPYPYAAPTFYDRSWGRSNYHAFQFLLDKRFSNGLAYMVSYTYSKSIDIGSSGWYGVEGHSVQDPYSFNNDRSISGFDLTHVLTVNALWEVPVGKGKAFSTGNTVADYVLGNWQVNAIMLLRSGTPVNLSVSGDIANTGNTSGYMRPNLVKSSYELSNPTRDRWFDTSAFAEPARYTFGNLGRYPMRSDGWHNFDISLFRVFPIHERAKLDFRAEMFNAFNSVVYGGPTSNLSSPNFGRVFGTANQARQIQLGMKLSF